MPQSNESLIAVLKSQMADVKEEVAVQRHEEHALDKRLTAIEIKMKNMEDKIKHLQEKPEESRLLERISLGLLAALGGLIAFMQSWK